MQPSWQMLPLAKPSLGLKPHGQRTNRGNPMSGLTDPSRKSTRPCPTSKRKHKKRNEDLVPKRWETT